jgi:hypothetical protein
MIRKSAIATTTLLLLLLTVSLLWSQERAATRPSSPGGPKQALVVGNSAYTHTSPLKNPVNDAKAIGSNLQQLGFEVTTLLDVNQRQMEQALRRFGSRLRDQNGVGLFYYAGHGMQVAGENYLLPVDINPSTETDVRYDAIPVGKLLGQMDAAGNGMNIVILDACRNNPFARSFRSNSRGLAQVIAPTGSFISYATAPGNVAADGEGDNGLFTAKLLEHMKTPGLKLEDVFKRVRSDVQRESNDQQVPWDSSSVTGDFFFVPPAEEFAPIIESEPVVPSGSNGIAVQAWGMIEQSEDPAIFRAFIEKFPDAPQRQLAELKLMLLSPIATTDKKTGSLDTKPSGTVQQTDFNAEDEKVLGIDGFVVEGQTTTDEETGLTWQREQVWRSWEEANSYCQTEHYGLSGWRLPKEAELAFLYQRLDSSKNRMLPTKIFPSLMRDHYWSGNGGTNSSWSVNFRDGKRTWQPNSGIAYVRCVRDTT